MSGISDIEGIAHPFGASEERSGGSRGAGSQRLKLLILAILAGILVTLIRFPQLSRNLVLSPSSSHPSDDDRPVED